MRPRSAGGLRVGPRPAEIFREGRVRLEGGPKAAGKAVEDRGGVALHEALGGVGERSPGGEVDVDLHARGRQPQLIGTRVVAAKPRAHHEHEVARPVERFDVRRLVEGAEGERVVFGHDATPAHARDDAGAEIREAPRARPGVARSAPQPEERPVRRGEARGEPVERHLVRRRRVHGPRGRGADRQRGGGHLDVGRDLDADRSARRGERRRHRLAQDVRAPAGIGHAERPLRNRGQHLELSLGLVDEAMAAAEVRRVDLPRQVEKGGLRRPGLDDRPRRVAAAGAGARDRDSEGIAGAGVTVRHVDRARFAP